MEDAHELVRDRHHRARRNWHRLFVSGVEKVSWLDALLLAIMALASIAFFLGELS